MAGQKMMEELSPESSRSGEHRLRRRSARGGWPDCLLRPRGNRAKQGQTYRYSSAGRPPQVAGGARPYTLRRSDAHAPTTASGSKNTTPDGPSVSVTGLSKTGPQATVLAQIAGPVRLWLGPNVAQRLCSV